MKKEDKKEIIKSLADIREKTLLLYHAVKNDKDFPVNEDFVSLTDMKKEVVKVQNIIVRNIH